jgi:hypothetical protein
MNPEVLAPLIPIAAIIAFAAVKIVGIRARSPQLPANEINARLEALEQGYEALHQELAETQERLDFAERILSKARDERRIGD